jgi:hypothetical protein
MTGCALVGAFALVAPALAGSATFTLLAVQDAADVTVDELGRTLVLTEDYGAMYLYEEGTYTYIGDGDGDKLSADASLIAGSAPNTDGVLEAARWNVFGGIDMLGGLPNSLSCSTISSGFDMSGDGSTIVGLSWDGCQSGRARAFKWTPAGGMIQLEHLGDASNRANVISGDGQVIAGWAAGNIASRSPAIWNASDNTGSFLNIDAQGEIYAINDDGTVVAGHYWDQTMTETGYIEPFLWTAEQGVQIIPTVPGYPGGQVYDMSADGRTLVGTSGIIIEGRTAMVVRSEWGMVELTAKLEELGAPVPDNFFPQITRGVSADGEIVVGWGILNAIPPETGSEIRGFIATLPEQVDPPCVEDLDGDGAVGFTDLTQLLGAWGDCSGCPEDFDGDGAVGFTDLTQLLGKWGPCA